MLTTRDNPFNPFVDWDRWYEWDHENGYNTPELLSRYIGDDSDSLDDFERESIEYEAINEIIDNGPIIDVWTIIRPDTKTPISNFSG